MSGIALEIYNDAMTEGIAQGVMQGMEKGMAQGMEKGRVEGQAQGRLQGVETALGRLVSEGLITRAEADRQLALMK